MRNPLSDMVENAKSVADEGKGLGAELKARGEMTGASPILSSAPKPAPARKPATWEKATGKPAPKGEKDMYKQASDWAKPMSFKDGGEVKKTGLAVVHQGEHVLTPEHKSHIKTALSMAEGALAHMQDKPEEPKKVVAEMRIRKGASGGHIVKHIHAHPMHQDEEHVTHDTDGLVSHVMQHMTEPNDGEKEADAGDPGIDEMEHAVGFRKGLAHPSSYEDGGEVEKTGMALVHKGEKVIPAKPSAKFVPFGGDPKSERPTKSESRDEINNIRKNVPDVGHDNWMNNPKVARRTTESI